MFRTTAAQLRAHVARVLASCLAIVIAVGFVVATLSLNASAKAGVLEAVGAQYTASDVVVDGGRFPAEGAGAALGALATSLAGVEGVAALSPDRANAVQVRWPGRAGSTYTTAEGLGTADALRWQRLAAGRLPSAPGEVAVSTRADVPPDTVLTVTAFPASTGAGADVPAEPVSEQVRVVGTVDLGGDPTAGIAPRLFATDAQLVAWGATDPSQLRLAAADGTSAAELRDRVAALLPVDAGLSALTGQEAAQRVADDFTGEAQSVTSVLLVFGAVAVLVAGLVIANTFAVVLAQRTREMALLRCVGATRGQVGRGVLLEALVVGLLASAVGVAAGAGLAAAVGAVVARTDAPIALDRLVVPPVAVVVGLLLGTLVTVAAAAAPARAATRVAPLAALRPLAPAVVRSRAGLVRLVLGLVVLVPSTVAMAVFARSGSLTPAVGAGALSFLGFLLVAQRLVPAVVAVAGAPFGRLGGVPARLAAGNASRNPRRTAATATALVIGVTLTTAMVVGAASTRASAADAIEAAYPTDVVVQGPDGVGAEVLDALRALDQVAAVAAVDEVQVVDAAGNGFPLTGVDPAAAREVVRSQQRSPVPADGQVVLSTGAAATLGVGDGERLRVRADPGTGGPAAGPQVELAVRVAAGTEQFAVATAADVRRAAPDVRPTGAWVRLREGLSTSEEGAAVDAVTDVVAGALPASEVSGVVALRSSLDQLLTTMLLIVTGLLAVAVVIALIGVGNTLALSVVERRQESGLLRALGLTRGQLRALLAWEALLVAGVAGVVGVVLGTGYGLAGTSSVLAAEAPVVLDVPWLQVAGIVVVAALAGVLASVLPARRAANTPPVAAIAD